MKTTLFVLFISISTLTQQFNHGTYVPPKVSLLENGTCILIRVTNGFRNVAIGTDSRAAYTGKYGNRFITKCKIDLYKNVYYVHAGIMYEHLNTIIKQA